MVQLDANIKRINDKLAKLLKQYLQLQKDNDRQSKLIATLQQEKEKNMEQLAALQQQVAILKTSAATMNDADKKNFEKHINQYIKEIDKCIGLLND